MRKLLVAALIAYSGFSFGATTVPIQLLNPTGSTAGQAIVSNGPSSAPSWQNTLATPTFTGTATFSGPALLNGGLQMGTGTTIVPTTTFGIKGTAAGDNANAGSIGEVIQSQVTTNTAWAPATGVAGNLTSISLTAGDWDVTGNVFWAAAAGSGLWTSTIAGISTTSATTPANYLLGQTGQTTAAATNIGYVVPTQRINVTTTTTVYLTGIVGYTSGSMNFQCQLRARRVR